MFHRSLLFNSRDGAPVSFNLCVNYRKCCWIVNCYCTLYRCSGEVGWCYILQRAMFMTMSINFATRKRERKLVPPNAAEKKCHGRLSFRVNRTIKLSLSRQVQIIARVWQHRMYYKRGIPGGCLVHG